MAQLQTLEEALLDVDECRHRRRVLREQLLAARRRVRDCMLQAGVRLGVWKAGAKWFRVCLTIKQEAIVDEGALKARLGPAFDHLLTVDPAKLMRRDLDIGSLVNAEPTRYWSPSAKRLRAGLKDGSLSADQLGDAYALRKSYGISIEEVPPPDGKPVIEEADAGGEAPGEWWESEGVLEAVEAEADVVKHLEQRLDILLARAYRVGITPALLGASSFGVEPDKLAADVQELCEEIGWATGDGDSEEEERGRVTEERRQELLGELDALVEEAEERGIDISMVNDADATDVDELEAAVEQLQDILENTSDEWDDELDYESDVEEEEEDGMEAAAEEHLGVYADEEDDGDEYE